jgi:hypothetical protein
LVLKLTFPWSHQMGKSNWNLLLYWKLEPYPEMMRL